MNRKTRQTTVPEGFKKTVFTACKHLASKITDHDSSRMCKRLMVRVKLEMQGGSTCKFERTCGYHSEAERSAKGGPKQ